MRRWCHACLGLILWPALAAAEPAPGGQGRDASAEDRATDPVIKVAPIDVRERGGETGVRALTGDEPISPEAERGLADPAFVTVVRVAERAGETASIADVLGAKMGVISRSLGGLGSFSSISVRGASASHTAVLVDGVPISRVATVTTDLGRYELDAFSELELYRGAVPIEYGGAALGGALNLVTRTGLPPSGRKLSLAAGVGSFGARRLRARWLGGSDDLRRGYHLSLGYAGATGNFSYFDNNGTYLTPDDDGYEERTNNAYDQIDSVARYRARSGEYTVMAGVRGQWKSQGIPGSASAQSHSASLSTLGAIVDGSVDKRRLFDARATATATAFTAVERQRYQDLYSEIGLGVQDRRYQTISAGATARASVELGLSHLVRAGVETRFDHFTDTDILAGAGDERTRGMRAGAGMNVSDELSLGEDDRVVLSAGVRLDILHTVPIGDPDVPVPGAEDLEPRTEIQPSPRLSARARIVPGLAIKGSAGWYFRAPTMAELFGDRGFIVGNASLESETGLAADLGVVIAPLAQATGADGVVDRIYIECAAFARRSRDTIAFVSGGSAVAYSRNLGDAQAQGVEASGSLRLMRTATLSANYTHLATRQDSPLPSFDGNALPGRPRHQFHGRIDLARDIGGHLTVLWSDINWTTGSHTDAAGLYRVPGRRIVGAGIKFEPMSGLLVGIEAKNLADQRIEMIQFDPAPRPDLARVPQAISDVAGFPLPGRAIYISAEWQH